jgi:hypothetical protein
MVAVRPAAAALTTVVVMAAACASGPGGLGKHACPYLRPRLIRLDAARLDGSTANVTAVQQDLRLYVRSNLPAAGKAKSDRPVVALSTALDRYVTNPADPALLAALDTAESAVKRECGVAQALLPAGLTRNQS